MKKFSTLDDAKGRRRNGLFVAEGTKCICDLSRTYQIEYLFASAEWLASHGDLGARNVVSATPSQLHSLTRLSTTPPAIACFRLPDAPPSEIPENGTRRLVLALDRIQDPGNLGTILRTADWMGVRTVVASPDTVDAFNPKTVQASMGAIAQVHVYYMPLTEYLRSLPQEIPVYATFLDGENVYTEPFSHPGGVLVMGNEGKGISAEVEVMATRRLTIPSWPPGEACAESLNVATATAIVMSQYCARKFKDSNG